MPPVFLPMNLLAALNIGCASSSGSKRRTRSQGETPGEDAQRRGPPPLEATARDPSGRLVYVDMRNREPDLDPIFEALRGRLLAVQPPDDSVMRYGKRINENRFLWQVTDAMAIDLFTELLVRTANDPCVGSAFRELLSPLGDRIKFLGAHFICGRLTEATPLILPQKLHRDVDQPGEVIAIALHLENLPMGTLIAAGAADVDESNPHLAAANTGVFGFDTYVVHGGPPGSTKLHRGPPRLVKNRVFLMICSESLPEERVASHREANDFRNIPNVIIKISEPPRPNALCQSI